MNAKHRSSATKTSSKLCILLMDANSDRRALRAKIMALHAVEVVGVANLMEARSIWNCDRYDMVLLDIRRDYHGCVEWRDEIKKESPRQIVAFLVGRPKLIDLAPGEDSYVAEAHALEWGNSLRLAIRKSCESLPQRNGFAEAVWRISAAKKINMPNTGREQPADQMEPASVPDAKLKTQAPSPVMRDMEAIFSRETTEPELHSFATLMETE